MMEEAQDPAALDVKNRPIQGYFKSKRTDLVYDVAVPKASNLSDVAQKPLMLECAVEFVNFI